MRTDDLIDSAEVAAILGLSHRNSVTTYSRRYRDFPRPVRVIGRVKLWARSDIAGWSTAGRAPDRAEVTSEGVRAELVAAAAPLMAERPAAEIPIREIAAAAGVSHSLIYRYFGSKEQLRRAVVEQAVAEMLQVAQALPGHDQDSMAKLIAALRLRRSSLNVLIQDLSAPHGAGEFFAGSAPVMAALLAGLRTGAPQRGEAAAVEPTPLSAQVAVGAVGALIVGWITFEPRIEAATGLATMPIAELAALCSEILARGAESLPAEEVVDGGPEFGAP